MLGLSPLGIVHTLISLVAVVAGVIAFLRDGRICPTNRVGQVYVVFTIATCLTALGIFAHSGFGPPHVVAVLTLVVLAVAAAARATPAFGRASRYVETLSYSATFLFHMIPAVTETATRLPVGSPLVASADSPALKTTYAVLLLIFLIGAMVQSAKLHHEVRLARR